MSTLWIVEIHEDDFEYDCFVSGAVWAETPDEAVAIIRAAASSLPQGERTRLSAQPAPTTGIVLEHWHAG